MTAAVDEDVDEDANQKEAPTRRSFLSNVPKLLVGATFAAVTLREFDSGMQWAVSEDKKGTFDRAKLLSSCLAKLEIENIDEFNSDLRSYYRTCFVDSINYNSSPLAQAFGLPSNFPTPYTNDSTINEKSPEKVRGEIEEKFRSAFAVEDKFDGVTTDSPFLNRTLNTVRAIAITESSMPLSRMMAFEKSDRGFADILNDCLSQSVADKTGAER